MGTVYSLLYLKEFNKGCASLKRTVSSDFTYSTGGIVKWHVLGFCILK